MQAEIWTKTNCPYCVKAKSLLEKNGVTYEEYIIGSDVTADKLKSGQHLRTREDLLSIVPNAKTVPQIWLNGNYVGGFTELEAFYKN